jgi:hypothetical protein
MLSRFVSSSFLNRKGHLLLLFAFACFNISVGQTKISSVSSFVKKQRGDYTIQQNDFIVVPDSFHRPVDAVFSRELIPGYRIVKVINAESIAKNEIVGVANTIWKLSPRMLNKTGKSGYYFSGHASKFIVSTFDTGKFIYFANANNITVLEMEPNSGTVLLSIKNAEQLNKVIHNEWVSFVDVCERVPREETLNSSQDLSVNHIAWVHDRFPGVNGESLTVSIRERTLEKNDIDLRGRIVESPMEDELVSFHANQMGTIIAGGGNSSEESRGIAWAAEVSSASFNSPLPDPDEYFQDDEITVQNHSYGFDVENYYGAEARAFDMQCNRREDLVHVFSSGNKGEESSTTGSYAGIPGFANLTGNMKMAKNIIVVGGHYDDHSIDTRNSTGPAYDGRIKPELVAYGPEGTSDAAAYVSGITVLLQDAYKSSHGSLPNSSLIRLALAVSADELATPGPDYVSGFGSLNAKRAMQVITSSQIISGNVTQGESDELTIDVPANTAELRIGLAWNDPAAEAGAKTALINDLDLEVIETATGEVYLPWILNPYPRIDSLKAGAKRGKDHLNNIEIVTLQNPVAGEYKFRISAGNVSALQKYSLIYVIDTADQFEWTFPVSTTPLHSGEEIKLRWNTTIVGDGKLMVKMNDGEYEPVADPISLNQRFVAWLVPAVPSRITFKMIISGQEYLSETVLAAPVHNFTVGYNCSDGGMLQWNRAPGSEGYVLYNLGQHYLEPILTGADTSFTFDSEQVSEYFALAPIYNGQPGRRSLTYNYKSTGALCYYRTFDAQVWPGGVAKLDLKLTTLFNVSRIVFEKKKDQTFSPLAELTLSDDLEYTFDDLGLEDGLSVYRAAIHLADGTIVYSNEDVVLFADERTYIVYPNPVAGKNTPLNILTDGTNMRFELIDTQGRVLLDQEMAGILFQLDVSRVPHGFYLYRFIRNSRVKSTGRIIIE